jgi:hypothetical protein
VAYNATAVLASRGCHGWPNLIARSRGVLCSPSHVDEAMSGVQCHGLYMLKDGGNNRGTRWGTSDRFVDTASVPLGGCDITSEEALCPDMVYSPWLVIEG